MLYGEIYGFLGLSLLLITFINFLGLSISANLSLLIVISYKFENRPNFSFLFSYTFITAD